MTPKSTFERCRNRGKTYFWSLLAGGFLLYLVVGSTGCRSHGGHWGASSGGWGSRVGHGGDPTEALDYVLDEVETDEAQRASLQRLVRNWSLESSLLAAQREALMLKAISLLESDSQTPEAQEAIQEEAKRLAAEAIDRGFRSLFEANELLRPDQRTVLAQQLREHLTDG